MLISDTLSGRPSDSGRVHLDPGDTFFHRRQAILKAIDRDEKKLMSLFRKLGKSSRRRKKRRYFWILFCHRDSSFRLNDGLIGGGAVSDQPLPPFYMASPVQIALNQLCKSVDCSFSRQAIMRVHEFLGPIRPVGCPVQRSQCQSILSGFPEVVESP